MKKLTIKFGQGIGTLKTQCKNGNTLSCAEVGLKKLFSKGKAPSGYLIAKDRLTKAIKMEWCDDVRSQYLKNTVTQIVYLMNILKHKDIQTSLRHCLHITDGSWIVTVFKDGSEEVYIDVLECLLEQLLLIKEG